MWLLYASGAAVFAGLTAILAKAGIRHTPSNLATAVRTIVVLLCAAGMVLIVGSQGTIGQISGRTLTFLVLSGLATGASWLCFFRALQLGEVTRVAVVDKSGIVLTVLFAIVLLGETDSLAFRLTGIALVAGGTWLMIERSATPAAVASAVAGAPETIVNHDADSRSRSHPHRSWLPYAAGSAVFAALTAILGKVGIEEVDSSLGTAIRTVVVLVMAWVVVAVTGEGRQLSVIPRRDLVFIALSGVATGASWLCYWRAMQEGPASLVAPVDRLSILVTAALAWLLFGERLRPRSLAGLGLVVVGTLVMLL
ncbi:EamA family transporter [Salana multivorans]